MANPRKNPNYEIGYKKPPKSTQFKAGQSGNRNGRPKGSLNFATEIDRELNTVVPINENGRKSRVKKRRIIAKQIVNKAAAGDLKASSILLNQARYDEQSQSAKGSPIPEFFAQEDQMVISGILKRLREYSPALPETVPESAADPITTTSQEPKEGEPS
jgi:hypothetical protein